MRDRELASYGSRVAARLVDIVVTWLLAGLVAAPWILAAVAAGDGSTAVIVTGVIFVPLAAAMWFFYEALFMMRKGDRNGQTIGKQMAGIRVVADSEQPMTFGTGALRDTVGKNVLGTVTGGLFSIVDYLWPLFESEDRALHDLLAKTHVVRA